jgi:TonB family protein
MPIYPEILRTTNVEGAVEMRVPVDTSGRAVLAGARVLRSGHQVFTWSVRDAVRGWRFESARRGRHRTGDTVRVAFTFTLTDEPPCPGRVHESAAVKRPARRPVRSPIRPGAAAGADRRLPVSRESDESTLTRAGPLP